MSTASPSHLHRMSIDLVDIRWRYDGHPMRLIRSQNEGSTENHRSYDGETTDVKRKNNGDTIMVERFEWLLSISQLKHNASGASCHTCIMSFLYSQIFTKDARDISEGSTKVHGVTKRKDKYIKMRLSFI